MAEPFTLGTLLAAGELGSVSVIWGVAGAWVSTVKVRETTGLSLPGASIALIGEGAVAVRKRRDVCGEVQLLNGLALTRHSKVEPASSEAKEKLGVESLVELPCARPGGDARLRRVGLGGEAKEGVVGGLRVAAVPQEPSAAAEAAGARLVGGRIAPEEPEEALHVPAAPVVQDQLEGVPEHPLLTLGALVDSELVGRVRSPAELGDPELRVPVVVLLHHPAELLERGANLVEVGAVRVQGGGVEAGLHRPDVVELVEEVPGLQVRVADHAGEHDPGLRILARRSRRERSAGAARTCRATGSARRTSPGWARSRSARTGSAAAWRPSELLDVAVGPVAAARSVARHRRLEEVLPRLPVGGALERGSGLGAGHPARVPPHERHRPDSVRGKAADEPVGHVPIEGALGRLNRRPVEQVALRPYPGGAQSPRGPGDRAAAPGRCRRTPTAPPRPWRGPAATRQAGRRRSRGASPP